MKTLLVAVALLVAPTIARAIEDSDSNASTGLPIPTLDCVDSGFSQPLHGFRLKALRKGHFELEEDIMSCGILTTTTQGLGRAENGALFDETGASVPTVNIELLGQRSRVFDDTWTNFPLPRTLGWIAFNPATKEATFYGTSIYPGSLDFSPQISRMTCK